MYGPEGTSVITHSLIFLTEYARSFQISMLSAIQSLTIPHTCPEFRDDVDNLARALLAIGVKKVIM